MGDLNIEEDPEVEDGDNQEEVINEFIKALDKVKIVEK